MLDTEKFLNTWVNIIYSLYYMIHMHVILLNIYTSVSTKFHSTKNNSKYQYSNGLELQVEQQMEGRVQRVARGAC